jgi:broad specificity phosphatase PhoE
MGTLVLVRHGQSVANKERRFAGGGIDSPLSDEGREQAKLAAQQLRGYTFDVAVCSEMCRTLETTTIILDGLGIRPSIIRSPLLNERDFGALAGQPKDECARRFGDRMDAWRDESDPLIGGEPFSHVRERVVTFFERELAQRLRSGQTVLFVGHNHPVRALLLHLGHDAERILENAAPIVVEYPR